jgi:hypothetical protein
VPSASSQPSITVASAPGAATVVGVLVASSGDTPDGLPSRSEL